MALYLKALGRNCEGDLVSCHGGTQIWPGVGGTVEIPGDKRGGPCQSGALHALRLRDLPHWLGTHYVVVEMDAREHDNKVYGHSAKVVRVMEPDEFDGLEFCVAFAEWCAEQGTDYNDAAAAGFLAGMFPAGFLDGVTE